MMASTKMKEITILMTSVPTILVKSFLQLQEKTQLRELHVATFYDKTGTFVSGQLAKVPYRAYPSFCSIRGRQLEVFLLPLHGMWVHRRFTLLNYPPQNKFASILGEKRNYDSKVLCPRTQKSPQPEFKPGPFDRKFSAVPKYQATTPRVHSSLFKKGVIHCSILIYFLMVHWPTM